MLLRFALPVFALAALGWSDTLTLRSGQVVRGEYVGGDARHIRMAVGDRVDSYATEDIDRLEFAGGNASADRPSDDRRGDDRREADRRDPGFAPVAPPAAQNVANGIQIPTGTT